MVRPDPARSRRRGAELERALYKAVLAELAEVGYGRLTMEGVAARAHTGKAAVYRRWPGKHALVLDVLRTVLPPLPEPDPAASARENLRAIFTALCNVFAGETDFPGFTVAVGIFADPTLRATFVETIIAPRLKAIESILGQAEQTGEIGHGALGPLAAYVGPALIQQAFMITGAAPTPAEIDHIVDTVLPSPAR